MKTFRFIGMALLAIVMCVNFASCSSDNDEESDTYDNEPWYIRVKSVSDTKLIIELLNDDNQTVDDTRDCVKQ